MIILKVGIFAVVTVLFLSVAIAAHNAEAIELSGKHAKEGLKCVDCHKVDKPVSAATMDACLECHGDYGKVAALTRSLHGNPHESHLGQLACTKCHGMHKANEIVCLECHSEFEFRIK